MISHIEPQPSIGGKLLFNNTEVAFRSKSNAELNRAYWLFKIISNNFLTRIGPPITNFALHIGLPVTKLIRNTIFDHFCGGETIAGCEGRIQQLAQQRVGTILDYSVEGEETEVTFDQVMHEVIKTIERAKQDNNVPFSVFKVTGLGRFDLLAKKSRQAAFSPDEESEFLRIKMRVDHICETAHRSGVAVLIDAEHSWVQDTIDDIARAMMRKYNKTKPIVYHTYQLYRSDILAALKADLYLAQTDDFFLGAKLVRGAYMELERERAEKIGYPSPIQPNKAATDRDYNEAISFCLDHLDRMAFVAGTHNEDSSRFLAEELDRRGIARNDQHVYFAQLLGMSDQLTFNLSEAGYNVAKYMPYGPIKAVMPYLFRRAQENTSIAGQTGRELSLIMAEKNRRKQPI